MSINDMTNELSNILINENDVDVITLNVSLEAILNFTDGRVWKCHEIQLRIFIFLFLRLLLTLIDNHEVCMTILVYFTNSSEKEANASVLKLRNCELIFFTSILLIFNYFVWLTSSPMTDRSFPLIAEWSAIVKIEEQTR